MCRQPKHPDKLPSPVQGRASNTDDGGYISAEASGPSSRGLASMSKDIRVRGQSCFACLLPFGVDRRGLQPRRSMSSAVATAPRRRLRQRSAFKPAGGRMSLTVGKEVRSDTRLWQCVGANNLDSEGPSQELSARPDAGVQDALAALEERAGAAGYVCLLCDYLIVLVKKRGAWDYACRYGFVSRAIKVRTNRRAVGRSRSPTS